MLALPALAFVGVAHSDLLAHRIAHTRAKSHLLANKRTNPKYEQAVEYFTWKYERSVRSAPWFQSLALWNDLWHTLYLLGIAMRALDAVTRMAR
ncbi:hypothetical protein FOA52_010000 [Chlamydomonas sp. UWO 241]|nr:hypothetical protein FOA52_010000 [Chlamydomonas sp. UWO 241]